MRRCSLHLADGDRLSRPVPLPHSGQVDPREGERPADPDRDARHLLQQGPRQEARSDRLPDEAQLTIGAGTHRRLQLYRVCPPIWGMTAIARNSPSSRGTSPTGTRLSWRMSVYNSSTPVAVT